MTAKKDPNILLAEEVSQFYDDPLGFVLFAFPWGEEGSQLVNFKGPRRWQWDFLEDWGEQIRERGFDGVNAVDPIQFSTSSGHGIGKAHALDMILETPSGLEFWGNIKPGDSVFDESGNPVRVKSTRHYQSVPFYRVNFDDGTSVECSSGHLWSVKGRQERRNKLGWKTISTQDIVRAGVKRKNGKTLSRQWEVPTQRPVEFEPQKTGLHPYLMGVWIGDGAKGRPAYCKPYPEVTDKIKQLGYNVHEASDGCHKYVRETVGLFPKDLLWRGSHERFIPHEYKFNSAHWRKELFKGLCDSDGEVHKSGSIGYSTTSKRLADDIIWLSRSLGCKAMMHPAVKKGSYLKDGVRVECKDCYRVTINAPFNPFSIKHKKEAFKPSEPRYTKRWIESIEIAGFKDGMCIEVDSDSGLYLCNDFVVTHNSAISSWVILFIASTRPHCKGIVTSNTSDQLKTKTWSELGKWLSMCATKDWFIYNSSKGNMNLLHKEHQQTWRIDAQTCREENSESFAGLHAATSTPFYLFDEASAIPDKIWEVSDGGLTDGEPMRFAFGNPTRNSGRFFECFGRLKHRWNTRTIDSRDVAGTNKDLLAQWIADFGEDSDFVRVRVRGVFPRSGSAQFVPSDLVRAAQQNYLRSEVWDFAPKVMGIDVARFGDDQSVITRRQGRKMWPQQKFRSLDLMTFAGVCAREIDEFKPEAVFVDGVGLGAGLVDRLRQLGYSVIDVQAGSTKTIDKRYHNKRAEMWGGMKDWFGDIPDIPEDPELESAITAVEYGFTGPGAILLESKDSMKSRGCASPDEGDSLALTFAEPVQNTRQRFDTGVADYDPLRF